MVKIKTNLTIAILSLAVLIGVVAPVYADNVPEAEFKDRRSLIVKLKDNFSTDEKEDSIIIKLKNESDDQATLEALDASEVNDQHLDDGAIVIKPEGSQSAQELLDDAKKDSNVKYAEPNNKLKASFIPNDSLYPQQWHLPKVKANAAWDLKPGGYGPIAVIDTGADTDHPDLVGRLNLNLDYDFVNSDNNAEDDNGHGTFTAGLISASINNGAGVAGISEQASIIPLKVLDANGEGYESDVASAIIYATDNGAKIINLSLGGNTQSQTLLDAINYANNAGLVVVAASGNDGAPNVSYPAAYPGVVAVGATDQNDQKASFSNWGSGLDVMAPGTGIISTYIGGGYASSNGTSASAPIVAGGLSLMMSSGNISKTEAINKLKTTSDKVGPQAYDAGGYNDYYGYGRLNVLSLSNSTTVVTPPPPLSLTPVYRFWSSTYNHHFYTASLAEKNHVIDTWPNVWSYESIAYYVVPLNGGSCPDGLSKVYRFWSGSFNGHFYTASEIEKNYVIATWPNVWSYEGAQYCVSQNQHSQLNTQVYRFWSGSFNGHFYTSSSAEKNHVIATWPNVWSYEGGVFWVAGSQ